MARLALFLLLNFGALGIGGLLIGNPSEDLWYQNINIAPWTPPGWVFGVAWFSIMLCFSFFMFYSTLNLTKEFSKKYYILFSIQFILNVIWNPFFFRWHLTTISLVIIFLLTILMIGFTYDGFKKHGLKGLLVLPYSLWLVIATSLNGYIVFMN